MKNLAFLFSVFLIFLASAQEKKITKSYLIGYWQHSGRIVQKDGYNVYLYIRSVKDSKNLLGLTNFDRNGRYIVQYDRIPSKCGNDRSSYRKDRYGTYIFNYEKQEIVISESSQKQKKVWNVVWINANSFGIVKD